MESQRGPRAAQPRGDQASRRALTRQATRDGLVHAANELFGEVGFDEARTSEIARRAGVAQATLFRHFDTKADLALFHLQAGLGDLVDAIRRRPSSECPFAAVVAAAESPAVVDAFDNPAARVEVTRLARHRDLAAHLCWLTHGMKGDLAGDFETRLGAEPGAPLVRALASVVMDGSLDALRMQDERRRRAGQNWLARALWELRPLFVAVGTRS